MKITAVTPFIVDPGYGKNWLFVKVETSDGLHGWGECYTQADRDHSIAAFVHQLARYLVGRGPITTSLPSAALWTSSEPSAGSSRRSGTSRASGSACPW